MRYKFWEYLLPVLLGVVLPGLLLVWPDRRAMQPEETMSTNLQPTESTGVALQTPENSIRFRVRMSDGSQTVMDETTYITAVVLGEMPARFSPEALKAQAVVARTYALKRQTTGQKHENGAVCTDPGCCQAYRDPEAWLQAGNTQENLNKVLNAVHSTRSQVLTYDGKLIDATYFSCSGGRTEDAVAVWGSDVPYLQAVESPGEEEATHYMDTVTFSSAEFWGLLEEPIDGESGVRIGEVIYTAGGGVDTIQIGKKSYKGTELRRLLGLRSTAFVISAVGDTITVTTKGFGHRVGMSQYGAEAMAASGQSYQAILAHYYQGTALQTWQE